MPRFFFDLKLQKRFLEDEDGYDYDSLKEAKLSAIRAAGELARDLLQEGTVGTIQINVRNESRQPVLRVTFSAKVEHLQ